MDIQQMTLNESKIMKLTKSKLKEMVRDVLSEEDKLDLNKAYGVYLRGGSIGSGKGQYIDIKTGAKLLYTFDSSTDASVRVKRSNARLTPGEKKYYGMKYTVVKMSTVKNRLKKS